MGAVNTCSAPDTPKMTVVSQWAVAHAGKSDTGSRVPREDFLDACYDFVEVPEAKEDAFEQYTNALFDTGTALMLPAQKTDLGKHCFGYMTLLAPEFYGDKPQDNLALAASVKPLDDFSEVRDDLDNDWEKVPKDSSGRVTEDAFVNYFVTKHSAKLVPQTVYVYMQFLKQNFKSCLAMMLPEAKSTLGGHCFRYGALIAGEFYFDAAKDAFTGCGCQSPVADVLDITK
mmetsp:Transcript_113945/g.207283  ORF Transcript_113945/g.207283 Transcript_113945/m.207283 type:complete len:229 (-) Transcript_113945:43-729(-)